MRDGTDFPLIGLARLVTDFLAALGLADVTLINPVERGTGGDDGVQIVGAVPLATSVAGATTGTEPRQQPSGGEVQQAHPPGRSTRVAGMAHTS
jgi:hypothetical protein